VALIGGFVTPWKDAVWNIIDVETTGIDPKNHRVIECAVVKMQHGAELYRWSQVFNPGREIELIITESTGITPEQLVEAPPIRLFLDHIDQCLEGGVWVAYNAFFDMFHLAGEFMRHGHQPLLTAPVDPFVWIGYLDKYEKGKKLVDACQRRGIALDAHKAVEDAAATGKLLWSLRDVLPDDYDRVIREQETLKEEQRLYLKSYWRKSGRDADAAEL
jgi:DNA polymerase III alpha subunit (gram-positive type)